MTWKQGALYAMMKTEDEDELGNIIKKQKLLWSGQLRFTPWTNNDIVANGRNVTSNEQRYVIPVAYETIKDAEQAEVNGILLNVTSVSDLGSRWTMIQVKVHKQ